jgi:RNA polymerase sigma-70 factor (sigma-E family)
VGETDRDAAFTAYVAARQRHLARLAYLLTGSATEAEDLVQAALAKVYRHWGSISGPVDAYVRVVMVNEHRSWWRRAWRHRETSGSHLFEVLQPVAPEAATADDELRIALSNLPRQQRACVVLRYYDDLTEAQTAATLGVSVGTVKSHTSRALTALRAQMKEQRA